MGELLEGGLEVLSRQGGGNQRAEPACRQVRRRLQTAVQIDRPQQRLQGISQERGLLPARLSFFPPPQQEVGPQTQAPGQGCQLPGIYQSGPPSGHLSFGTFGKPGQQERTDGEGQNRVPQELQPFIAGAAPRVIMGIRTVAQGLVQQPQILETLLQPLGQAFQFLPPGGGTVLTPRAPSGPGPGRRREFPFSHWLPSVCLHFRENKGFRKKKSGKP